MSETRTGPIADPQESGGYVISRPLIEFATVDERNAWLDRQLNPDSLPQVTLAIHKEYRETYGGKINNVIEHMIYNGEQELLGAVSLVLPTVPTTRYAHIGNIDIGHDFHSKNSHELKSYVGKGYGMAAYRALMQSLPLGVGLESGSSLTPRSYRVWRRLESMGVATSNIGSDEAGLVTSYLHGAGITYDGSKLKFKTLFGGP